MKNKGFTLIELLAVIVILAIIALIAVPIILNIIDSSKNSANERSKELYLDAVEQAIARKNLTEENGYNPTSCEVKDENGTLKCLDGEKELAPLTVEVNGAKPSSGKITFKNGKVTEETLVFGDGTTNKEEPVSQICTLVEGTSQEVGAKYTCSLDKDRTFYVLETSGDNVSLLMEQNFTDGDGTNGTIPPTVSWCTDGGHDNKTCTNIDTYVPYIQTVFNTEGVTVSFPTKEQIEGAYTDTMPEWMYDYLYGTTHSVSGLGGYWTVSPRDDNSFVAWLVTYSGLVESSSLGSGGLGLRPVITISKYSLN